MPLIRRIPKRGFNNARHTTRYIPVNLESLNQFSDGARVDFETLRKAGLANGKAEGVKILGTGELTRKLTVTAHAFSASARAKIEGKGGACEIIAPKKSKRRANRCDLIEGDVQKHFQYVRELLQDSGAEVAHHLHPGGAGDLPCRGHDSDSGSGRCRAAEIFR